MTRRTGRNIQHMGIASMIIFVSEFPDPTEFCTNDQSSENEAKDVVNIVTTDETTTTSSAGCVSVTGTRMNKNSIRRRNATRPRSKEQTRTRSLIRRSMDKIVIDCIDKIESNGRGEGVEGKSKRADRSQCMSSSTTKERKYYRTLLSDPTSRRGNKRKVTRRSSSTMNHSDGTRRKTEFDRRGSWSRQSSDGALRTRRKRTTSYEIRSHTTERTCEQLLPSMHDLYKDNDDDDDGTSNHDEERSNHVTSKSLLSKEASTKFKNLHIIF